MSSIVMILSSLMFAHAEQKAHVHGSAEVSIAFDKNKGKIVFNSPTEAVYGFEYAPKTKKDKQRKESALKKLEESIGKMIVFPESAACEIKKDVIEVNESGNHADVAAEFNVSCKESPAGNSVTFNFNQQFKGLKKVKVEVLVDDIQKSLEVKSSGEKLELK